LRFIYKKADKKSKKESGTVSSGPTTSADATDESEKNNKKRSIDDISKSKHTVKGITGASSNGDLTKKAKSIQEDPNASDVYKSLFNTCEKAKKQTQGHWVTFNPQYF